MCAYVAVVVLCTFWNGGVEGSGLVKVGEGDSLTKVGGAGGGRICLRKYCLRAPPSSSLFEFLFTLL